MLLKQIYPSRLRLATKDYIASGSIRHGGFRYYDGAGIVDMWPFGVLLSTGRLDGGGLSMVGYFSGCSLWRLVIGSESFHAICVCV